MVRISPAWVFYLLVKILEPIALEAIQMSTLGQSIVKT
jgi:hypothetical protein